MQPEIRFMGLGWGPHDEKVSGILIHEPRNPQTDALTAGWQGDDAGFDPSGFEIANGVEGSVDVRFRPLLPNNQN